MAMYQMCHKAISPMGKGCLIGYHACLYGNKIMRRKEMSLRIKFMLALLLTGLAAVAMVGGLAYVGVTTKSI